MNKYVVILKDKVSDVIEDGLNSLAKANNEIVADITTLSATTEEVTASAQQS